MISIPLIPIDSSLKIFSGGPRSGKASPALQIGEILDGRVLDLFDENHGLIQMKEQVFPVTSQFPLSKGMEYRFRVEATESQVVLKVLPEETGGVPLIKAWSKPFFEGASPEGLGKALSRLSGLTEKGGQEVQEAFRQLQGLLTCFSFQDDSSLDLKRLEAILVGSGLFFEGKMKSLIQNHLEEQGSRLIEGDLKALLMKLISHLKSEPLVRAFGAEPPFEREDALDGLNQVLQRIEGYQLLNLHSLDNSENFFLLLPLWLQSNLYLGEMALSLPRRDQDRADQGGISILFMLQLPDLGRMRIDVKVKEKVLFCSFNVSDEKISALFDHHLPDLQERLAGLGFEAQLKVSVGKPDGIVQTFLQETEAETETSSEPFVNIVV